MRRAVGPWASSATSRRPAARHLGEQPAPDGAQATPVSQVGGDIVDECGPGGYSPVRQLRARRRCEPRPRSSTATSGARHTVRPGRSMDLIRSDAALPARAPPTTRVITGRPSQAGSRRPRTSHGIGAPGSATGRNLSRFITASVSSSCRRSTSNSLRVAVYWRPTMSRIAPVAFGDQVGDELRPLDRGAARPLATGGRSPARAKSSSRPLTRGRADSFTGGKPRGLPRPICWTSSSEASWMGAVKDPCQHRGAVGRLRPHLLCADAVLHRHGQRWRVRPEQRRARRFGRKGRILTRDQGSGLGLARRPVRVNLWTGTRDSRSVGPNPARAGRSESGSKIRDQADVMADRPSKRPEERATAPAPTRWPRVRVVPPRLALPATCPIVCSGGGSCRVDPNWRPGSVWASPGGRPARLG